MTTLSASQKIKLDVGKFRAMAWFDALHIQSGLNPPSLMAHANKGISTDADGNKWKSGQLYQFKNGKRPLDANSVYVEDYEIMYPGSSYWIKHPMWELIDVAPIDNHRIYQILVNHRIASFDRFFNQIYHPKPSIERRLWSNVDDIKQIALEPTLDAFVFLLGLMRESENRLLEREHSFACSGIRRLVPVIFSIPALQRITGYIMDYLEVNHFQVLYRTPHGDSIFTGTFWREKHKDISLRFPQIEPYPEITHYLQRTRTKTRSRASKYNVK